MVAGEDPLMAEEKKDFASSKRAPTLYAIIAIKLLKGLLLLTIGLGLLSLIGQDLDARFDQFLRWVHLDPEKKFFADLGDRLQKISPSHIKGVGIGTMLYSLFSFVEGVGLVFRLRWIGWIVIGESLFFIPIEVYELMRHFAGVVFGILIINIVIVWYLLKNRDRIFKHHA
jgi:uncharacterized membrane protein (DUF2068 family)